MGLDLAFNKQAVLDAGLVITHDTNGDPESIAREQAEDDSSGLLEWLLTPCTYLDVPNTDLQVHCTSGQDSVGEAVLIIRANKWGHVYEPMTQWLKANGIAWGEF